MKQQEINLLAKVKTDSDVKFLYPNAKIVDSSRPTHVFYNIKPNVWIRCSYMMKDGKYCRDFISGDIKEIDSEHLVLDKIYSGNEKTQEYNNIWEYKVTKNDNGIYRPKG